VVRRQADRADLPFASVVEAELLILLMSAIIPDARWYPGTLHYSDSNRESPFLLRCAQHKDFEKLAVVTGFKSAAELRVVVREGLSRLGVARWDKFFWSSNRDFWQRLNMDGLDTVT